MPHLACIGNILKINTIVINMHTIFSVQNGDTALHNACTQGHTDAVEALIAACADRKITNKVQYRYTGIDIEYRYRYRNISGRLLCLCVLKVNNPQCKTCRR